MCHLKALAACSDPSSYALSNGHLRERTTFKWPCSQSPHCQLRNRRNHSCHFLFFFLLAVVVLSFPAKEASAATAPSDVTALQNLYKAYGSLPGNLSEWLSTDPCNDPVLRRPVFLVNCSSAAGNSIDPISGQPYSVITGIQLAGVKAVYPKDPVAYPTLYGGALPTEIGAFQNLQDLLMTDMGLKELPESIGGLQSLQQLWVDNNQLAALPIGVFGIPSLTTLSINSNLLQELPPDIGNLTNLARLDVSYNPWAKVFPANIGDLPRLDSFIAQTANLLVAFGDGFPVFPEWLWRMKSLKSIILDENPGFGAIIPPELGRMPNLGYFSATNANLTGPIPATLGQLPYFGALRLSFNQLNGSIPATIGNLSVYLHTLELDHNKLSGFIPEEVAALTLRIMDLSYNSLSGPFPLALANATGDINLSYNNLTGPLPSFLAPAPGRIAVFNYTGNPWCTNIIGGICPAVGQAQALQIVKAGFGNPIILTSWRGSDPCQQWFGVTCSNGTVSSVDLTNAGLRGTMPPELLYLKDLQTLKLSGNLLSGPIPETLTNLTSLSALYMDRNNFTGTIPPSLSNLTRLAILNVSGNALSGFLPAFLGQLQTAAYANQRGQGFCNTVPGTPCVTFTPPPPPPPATTAPAATFPSALVPVSASSTTGGSNSTLPVATPASGAAEVAASIASGLLCALLASLL